MTCNGARSAVEAAWYRWTEELLNPFRPRRDGGPPKRAPKLGGFSVAAAIMVCFALLSVVAMLIGRETKGRELPH